MNVSVVIPNYNGLVLLKKNIPKVVQILREYHNEFEIIIVDDGSTDGSKEFLATLHDSYRISNISFISIFNKKNLGFSSTVDFGIRKASYELVLLLNSDVVPEKDFLLPLIPYFQDSDVFGVGCMDKSIENGKTILRGRGIGVWKKGFMIHSRGEIYKNNTLWLSGGSMMIRKQVYLKIGGFDNLYDPFYWEDIDLSYRALKSGYKIFFEKKSIVVHSHEKGAIKKFFTPSQIKKFAYRNQVIFVWKNITDVNLVISHILWLPVYIIRALLHGDTDFLSGIYLAGKKLPVIINKRFQQNKAYIKSDIDVLYQFTD